MFLPKMFNLNLFKPLDLKQFQEIQTIDYKVQVQRHHKEAKGQIQINPMVS